MSKSIQKLVLVSLAFIFVGSAQASMIIGTIASPREGEYALIGGTYGAAIGAYITNNVPGSSLVGTQVIDSTFLSTIDILIINSASSFTSGIYLSASEQAALFNFVKSGKNAIIVADGYLSSSGDSFGAPFGLATGAGAASKSLIVDTLSPIANGPYGVATTLTTDQFGVQTAFLNVGPYAHVVARSGIDGSGNPVIATIDRNAITPGSGRVVFLSDAGLVAGSVLDPNPAFLNAIAYVAVPEASTIMMMSIVAAFGATSCLLRKRSVRK